MLGVGRGGGGGAYWLWERLASGEQTSQSQSNQRVSQGLVEKCLLLQANRWRAHWAIEVIEHGRKLGGEHAGKFRQHDRDSFRIYLEQSSSLIESFKSRPRQCLAFYISRRLLRLRRAAGAPNTKGMGVASV